MEDQTTGSYICAYCGEENETIIDPFGGPPRTYTEDCAVCCRPNVLKITFLSGGGVHIEAEFEG